MFLHDSSSETKEIAFNILNPVKKELSIPDSKNLLHKLLYLNFQEKKYCMVYSLECGNA